MSGTGGDTEHTFACPHQLNRNKGLRKKIVSWSVGSHMVLAYGKSPRTCFLRTLRVLPENQVLARDVQSHKLVLEGLVPLITLDNGSLNILEATCLL